MTFTVLGYAVVDEDGVMRSHWLNEIDAEIAAAEANADFPFGVGPFSVEPLTDD
jgi:hypothetical protein